jgi:hypothetical protein
LYWLGAAVRELETLDGPAGRAQNILAEPDDIKRLDHSATLSAWFITAPGQSIFWSNFLLAIYHLRDIEGVASAKKVYEGVTHELILVALNPDRNPQPLDMQTWQHMTPINFVIQVELPSDEKAKELLALAAHAVVDGALWAEPPLSGQQEPWRTSILRTAAHLRGEAHGM